MIDAIDTCNSSITRGNAIGDGANNRGSGWFIGHFIPPAKGGACTKEVEVKWGVHKAGEEKNGFGTNQKCKTISLLIRGRFMIVFPNHGDVCLEKEGDYVIFGEAIAHSWRAEEDSIVLSIRWPSLPNDQVVNRAPFPAP